MRIKFLSDTVSFDSGLVNNYLDIYADHNPLHLFFENRFDDVVCTSNVAQGLSKVSHKEGLQIKRACGWYDRDETCRKKLKIPDTLQPTGEHNHDAVSDARFIAQEHVIQLNWATNEQ
jgi:hypothetical protein